MDNYQCGLEIFLSALLFVSIIYSAYLGRSLALLRKDRSALAALVSSLQESSRQAESGIEQLHRSSESVGRQLSKQTEQARVLKAEVISMLERAEIVTDRLDRSIRSGKSLADSREVTPMRDVQIPYDRQLFEPVQKGKSLAEQDLMRALRMK